MKMPSPFNENKPKQDTAKLLNSDDLKLFMNHHGFSENELASLLGVSRQAVNSWRNDVRDISPTISKVLRLLDKYPQLMKEF